MSMTSPFPEPDSPELERFAVYGRQEIAALLRELRDRQVLLTLYYGGATGFAVSNVLDVNLQFEEVILDCAADRAAQGALYQARDIVVVGFLDNAKIQFDAGAAEPVTHQNRSAFRIRLPNQVLRMQRRVAERRQPLPSRPATCLVPVPGEAGRYEAMRVIDLGVGGVALAAHALPFDLHAGQVLAPCYLDLPEIGQITVTLQVRYVEGDLPAAGDSRRCGCEFIGLGGTALRTLQRYVNRLDGAAHTGADRRAA
jgi:c-di-GMP-binding flagellar brake protein YcgR